MNNIKPYTKYKQSGIAWLGDIPEHWEVRKLKNNARIKTGRTPKIENSKVDYFKNGNIDWFTPSDFKNPNGSLSNSRRKINISSFNDFQVDSFQKNTVFLVGIGATIGKIGISSSLSSANQQINAIIFNENIIPKFGYYALLVGNIQIKFLADFTTLPILNQSKTKEIVTTFPPLSEQDKIANFLDFKLSKIDRFIKKKKQLIKLLNEQKAGIINDAVTKGLIKNVKMKSSGIEWLGDIPVHWEVRKLKYVADCFPSNIDKHSREDEKQVRLCNYTDVYKNDYIFNEMSLMIATATADQISKFTLLKDDVIITKDSETADDIANPALVIEDLDNVVCGYHLSVLRPEKNLIGAYLFRTLQVKAINIQFEIHSNGVTRVGLGVYDLKNAEIPVPPLSEQQQIISHIETETAKLNKAIATIEKEIALVQEYKTALIAEAVTGKIDVRDYEFSNIEEEKLFEELEEKLNTAAEDEAAYQNEEIE